MRNLIRAALLAGALVVPAAAGAQSAVERRVDALEGEVHAIQRVVFPGGAGKYVSPQITAPDTASALPGTPATSPVADLETRVSALERQHAAIVGQIEQLQFRQRQDEDAFTAYKRTVDARLGALEQGASAPAADPVAVAPAPARPAAGTGLARPTPAPARPVTTPKPTANPARAARLAAIPAPAGDGAEDSYMYGYRLWDAKLYPEAETALKGVVDKYPTNRRASYAQNLLGRAYLDEGRPSLASMAFYDSYKRFPNGERAPHSLYYLAQALVTLGKPADACKVYAELAATYGTRIDAQMKSDVAKGRAAAKCQ